MKKIIILSLVLSLALSPVFSLGEKELGLRTIFLRSKEATPSLTEKPVTQSTVQNESETVLIESQTSPENSEIVTEIISIADEASKINQATLHSLYVVQNEVKRQADEIVEMTTYIGNVEDSLERAIASVQDKEVKLAEKEGEINTLNEKLDARKSYQFLLAGADFNLADGYGISLDYGVKFSTGLTAQVGASIPIDDINPIGLVDINSYSFNTKLGWSW